MNDVQKKAIHALHAAALALVAATTAAVASIGDDAPAAAKPAEPAKPKAAAKAAAPPATPPAATVTTPAADDLITQARKAAVAYAGTFGKAGLTEIIRKYTEGSLADVAPEKLPELIKDLS